MGEITDEVSVTTLKAATSALDSANPLRLIVRDLPDHMALTEYAALVPSLWHLSER
jgi:hypothetical protein